MKSRIQGSALKAQASARAVGSPRVKDREAAVTSANNASPDVVIITGLSGSGMTSATNAFEDLGYFCVDNMPLMLLPTFARLVQARDDERGRIERAALVISFREGHFLSDFAKHLRTLRKRGLTVAVLFFEASDEILARRFSETRRPHPAERGKGLRDAIRTERTAMKRVRASADEVIDTSEHTVHTLRKVLLERFKPSTDAVPMRIQVLSFGHKFGPPREMELLFDVRHLPNPFFISTLKNLPGDDLRVIKYLKAQPEVEETLRRFTELLNYLLPQYKREGKSYLTVGIGCTGGRHRSVMIANELAARLRKSGFDAQAVHRDVKQARKRASAA
jgi:UPF0042 nucleotide-binding protein